jgi:hypothetical protein
MKKIVKLNENQIEAIVRGIILSEEMSAQEFLAMVNDEWDIETLDLMLNVINQRRQDLQQMQDIANPRNVVKGFRKDG